MKNLTKIIAVGAAHWDILGRAQCNMDLFDDVPGRVRRTIGGVAGPVAMKLARIGFADGVNVQLMGYVGDDELGDALLGKLEQYHVRTNLMIKGAYPTDVYLGIEAPNGLIAAIADCHSLEAVSADIIDALISQNLEGYILIVDGNLEKSALEKLARSKINPAKFILVPASPGKIDRFLPFAQRGDTSLYVNLREANALAGKGYALAQEAAEALISLGYTSALVSNGAECAAHATKHKTVTALPPQIDVKRYTGAGDTLTAHHIFAELSGDTPDQALKNALKATAHFISHEDLDV